MLGALMLALLVLLVPSSSAAQHTYFSYNISTNLLEETYSMFRPYGFNHFVPSYDLSGPLWRVKALDSAINLQPGFKFNMTLLPKDSGLYGKIKADEPLSYDSVKFTKDGDYDQEELTPKKFVDYVGGSWGLYSDDGYGKHHQKSYDGLKKKSSSGGNAKTFEGKLMAVKRDYRNEAYPHADLDNMNGVLVKVRNARINIKSFLEISNKKYLVEVKLWDVEMNKTVHFDVKNMSVKLVSIICSLKSRMNVTVFNSDRNIEILRHKMDFQKVLLEEMCKALNKNAMMLFKNMDSPNKLVYKLYEGLYFDMRVSKLMLTNDTFGVGHVGEFIFSPKMIKKLPSNPDTQFELSFSASKDSYMSGMMKVVQEDFISANPDYLCKEMISETFERVFTKEYVILDKEAGKEPKVGEDKTKGDFLFKMRVDEEMLNTFAEGLIATNLTSERITQLDMNDGCANVTLIKPICEALAKCPKILGASGDNFTVSIKKLRNLDGKYLSFKDDAFQLNTTYVISFNGKTVKVTNLMKVKYDFNDYKFSHELVNLRFNVTASEKFHSSLDTLLKNLWTKLSVYSSRDSKQYYAKIFSSLRDGSFNLAVNL